MTGPERGNPAEARRGFGSEQHSNSKAPAQYTAPAPEIAIPARPGRHRMPCPHCDRGASDTALSVLVDSDGSACWFCWRCHMSGGTRGSHHPPRIDTQRSDDSERHRKRLRRLRDESVPLDFGRHELAATYLRQRGLGAILEDPPGDLRFHPRLDYWRPGAERPECTGHYPALLAIVRDPAGNPVSIHRTYLRRDGTGKADVPSPRKLCPPVHRNGLRGG